MTIEHKPAQATGAEAYFAFCRDCDNGKGRHIAQIHNGYGDSAEPITTDDIETVEDLADQHEARTGHNIIIFQYKAR